MSDKVMLGSVAVTKDQRAWLEEERVRTGDSIVAIVRGLIQDKIDSQKGEEK